MRNRFNLRARIVTLEDLVKISKQKRGQVSVEKIAHKKLIVAHPEDSILEAF